MIDLTGKRFTRLLVLSEAPRRDTSRMRYWLCQCDCGEQREVSQSHLLYGGQTSCGCLGSRTTLGDRKRTHGNTCGRKPTPEYKSWQMMKRRCTDPEDKRWPRYGGRGISVCAEWLNDFEAFLAHVGPRPSAKHSLDRIDTNGNYEVGNVRWALPEVQMQNRDDVHLITLNGETLCLAEWCRRTGLKHNAVIRRLNAGWSAERALTTPPLTQGRKTGAKRKP